MKSHKSSNATLIIIFLLIAIFSNNVEGKCKPSGEVRGQRAPPGQCSYLECCLPSKIYPTYHCSPHVSPQTKAVLRVTSFETEGIALCDNKYHSDSMMVVAMSTGWFNNGERCGKTISIHGNGKSVRALVVDESDSTIGCDADHDYQPPSPNNVIDASRAVWKALGVPPREWGELDITWSDA